jgi:hypothetical protein
MSHEQRLLKKVRELRTRVRLLIAQQWACAGLTAAALAGLLLVAATRFRWWTDAVDYLWALLLLGAVAGLVAGWTRRITPLVAAQLADERAGLKERLSTAVELSALESRSEIAEAQIADAAEHADGLRAGEVLPWRAPRQARYLAFAGVLLLAALFVPDLPLFQRAQARVDREVMQKEGERIRQVAKEIEKKAAKKGGDTNDEIMRRIAREMQQLGKEQSKNRISKKQAMLKMNELQKQLKEAESAAGNNSQKSLDKVATDLQDAASRQSERGNQESAKALQQMADNLKNRDFDGAKKQLEELAKKMQSGQMTADEAGKAADTLKQMAEAMEGSGLEKASQEMKEAAKQLEKAAQAAKEFQQKLAEAKTDEERRQIEQQMSEALQQGMEQAAQQCEQAGGT